MPGHVKTGGPKEADPDPSEFLIVSFEMKKEDALKPYDAKKSVWVPDGEGGFDEAMIDTVDGDKVNVKVGWGPKTFKSAQVMQVILVEVPLISPGRLLNFKHFRSIHPRWRSLTMSPT